MKYPLKLTVYLAEPWYADIVREAVRTFNGSVSHYSGHLESMDNDWATVSVTDAQQAYQFGRRFGVLIEREGGQRS